jgi:hypothetical protein
MKKRPRILVKFLIKEVLVFIVAAFPYFQDVPFIPLLIVLIGTVSNCSGAVLDYYGD